MSTNESGTGHDHDEALLSLVLSPAIGVAG